MSTLPQPLSHCLVNQLRPMVTPTPSVTDIKPMIPMPIKPLVSVPEVKPGVLPGMSHSHPPISVPNLPNLPSLPSLSSHPSVSSSHNQHGVGHQNPTTSVHHGQPAGEVITKNCPAEFLHQNPQSERQLFFNNVAMQLYNSDYEKFASKKEFHGYLLEQQKWRWDTHSYIGNLETRVHNLLVNPNSGVAQNVTRYRTIPIKCKSEDVKRCEATSKELENMATRIASVRQQLLHKKGTLLSSSEGGVVVWQNELAYLEQLFDRTDQMYNEVLTTLASVNQTWAHLQTCFTTEAAELADRRRMWRRRKENNRKRRKRMERQLEKMEQRSCELLFHITSRAAYDRVRSHPEVPRIGPGEINIDMLNGIKSKSDVRPLMHLLSKGYLTPGAMEMVSQKIQKLECGIKTEAHQQASQIGINSLAAIRALPSTVNSTPPPATCEEHQQVSHIGINSLAAIRALPSTVNSTPPPVTCVNSTTLPVTCINSTVSQQTVPTVNLNTQLAK